MPRTTYAPGRIGPEVLLSRNLFAATGGKLSFFGAAFVRNLLLARLFDPLAFGSWNLGVVLLQYMQWSHLTLLNAFRLEGARSLGSEDTARFQTLQRLTWNACVIPALAVTLVSLAACLMIRQAAVLRAVVMMSALLLPSQLYAFATSSLNTEEKFVISGRLIAAYAFSNLALTVLFSMFWGFWGAVAAQVVSYVAVLGLYRRYYPIFRKPLWNGALFHEQLKIGLPIGLSGIVYGFFITIDRTMVATVLGMTALGYYGLTSLARASLGLIPDAISEVIYMRISVEYGRTRSSDSALHTILRADVCLAALTPPFLGLGAIWAPSAIHWFLPNYAPGITAMQIFLLGMFFAFPVYPGVLLTSLGRGADLVWLYGTLTGIQAMLLLFWLNPLGIVGAALATALSSALLFLAVQVWGLQYVRMDRRHVAHHIGACILPFLSMIVGVVGGRLFLDRLGLNSNSLLYIALNTLLCLGFTLPLSWRALKPLLRLSKTV